MREYIVVLKVDEQRVFEANGFAWTEGINVSFAIVKELEKLEDAGISVKYLKNAK